MGMDVYGKKYAGDAALPKRPDDWDDKEAVSAYYKALDEFEDTHPGYYFRRNVWGWHPLWDLCCELVPDICSKVEYGHSNDGDGLDADDSAALAAELHKLLNDGSVDAYIDAREATLAGLPLEKCNICDGTGKRKPVPEVGAGNVPCNGCDSKGTCVPWATNYNVSRQDVEEWVAFLEDCGGFEIH